MNIQEGKNVLRYFIHNNRKLEEQGKKTTAVSLTGDAGVGKTDAVKQVADELGMTFVKLNVSQIDEVGDLLGFPLKEFYMCSPDGKSCDWIATDVLDYYLKSGWTMQDNMHRMSYAVPAWVPRDFNPNGTILFLDDYTRANPLILQSCMELIDRKQMISWNLPAFTNIILSCNPDNGEFNVNSLDSAMSSRFVNLNIDFDVNVWSAWADDNDINSMMVNFALNSGSELFGKVKGLNARSYTTFANAINDTIDLNTKEGMSLICMIANGCFDDKDGIVASLLASFINNKLDRLLESNEILDGDLKEVLQRMEECVYSNGIIKSPISRILMTRFINYILKNKDNEEFVLRAAKRMMDIFNNPKILVTKDIQTYTLMTIFNNLSVSNRNKFIMEIKKFPDFDEIIKAFVQG